MKSGPILLALAVALALGCPRDEDPQQAVARLTPEQAADARRTITLWLECEECTEGQLEAVERLGAAAIPTLGAVLREGPSPAKLEALRRSLQRSYRQLRDYERTHPNAKVPMGEEEYVNTFLDNYAALHRIRAARALAKIGGPHARKELEQAPRGARPDVQAAVRASLDSTQ